MKHATSRHRRCPRRSARPQSSAPSRRRKPQAHHHTVVPADEVKWGPAPPSLPPGAQAAVLLGSPAKEGPFVLRLKFPAGFTVPPHRHSKDEFVTVISGEFAIASGEKLDRAAAKPLPPAASSISRPACRTTPSPTARPSCRSTASARSM